MSHAILVEADIYAGMKRSHPGHRLRRCLLRIWIMVRTKRRFSRRRNSDLRTRKKRGMLSVSETVVVNPWLAKKG